MTIALHRFPTPQPTRALRIGVLTPHNPFDRRCFSGTAFYAVKALEDQRSLRVKLIGPHRPARRLDRLLRRASPRLEPDMLSPDGSDFRDLDVILGLVATPLLDRAASLTDLPMLHVTDATPGFLSKVYERDVPREAIRREARVLARATPVYSSQMMADLAKIEFGTGLFRPRAIPFGVNFLERPKPLSARGALDRLEVLFVGGDWERKGGAIALEAFDRIRASGRSAHLTLVGNVPAAVRATLRDRQDVTITGFLDKNKPNHLSQLVALFNRAHIFLLPTRADCTPMVVAEALACGTPVLASDVGGIAEMVSAGAGRSLPLTASAEDWSAELLDMTEDRMSYEMMSDAAIERTEYTLNWGTWANGIAGLAAETIASLAHEAA